MATKKKHQFKAEIQQLLDIVIHSLYTDKEIFLRELVSNAADACEKLRFLQSSGVSVSDKDREPGIFITTDEKEKTISITDTGIGMTREELVENLGMIAHSGSKAFMKQLEEGKKGDATLIGQFGVGFYSAFMVADKVQVYSRSSTAEDDQGWLWTSEGSGSYSVEEAGAQPRGTRIVLELKKDDEQFAEKHTVERIVKNYSNFVPFAIELNGTRINTVEAIWKKSKSDVKEEDYEEFYKFIGHDHEKPTYRLHFNADAPLAINALLFVPSKNMETLGMSRMDPQVSLHCKTVLIERNAKDLVPEWMRFVRGVVDSEDLPLNISRESMQDSALLQKLNSVVTKRFIKFLAEQAKKDPETYNAFFGEFGRFIKEGVINDFGNKDALGKLLRFESSGLDAGKMGSLEDYVGRMREEQKDIYFLMAPNREAILSSPYYEVFSAKKLEVLFVYDPWDEFVMDHLREFDGKNIVSAEKAEINLEDQEIDKNRESLSDAEAESLAKWLKDTLGDKVQEARVSKRLVDSPAVVVDSDKFMTATMRQIMKSVTKDSTGAKVDLEINPRHSIITGLNKARETNKDLAVSVAEQIFDNALAASGLLEDPRKMVGRLNSLLEKVLANQEGKGK